VKNGTTFTTKINKNLNKKGIFIFLAMQQIQEFCKQIKKKRNLILLIPIAIGTKKLFD